MGRYTDKLTRVLSAKAERARVADMPRDEYLDYVATHPDFRSGTSQIHGDATLLLMREIAATYGSDAASNWASRKYWLGVGNTWRAENRRASTSSVEAFGLTFLFNGAKYGAVLAVAYLALPGAYFAAFLPVFSGIVLLLSVAGAFMRKVI